MRVPMEPDFCKNKKMNIVEYGESGDNSVGIMRYLKSCTSQFLTSVRSFFPSLKK